MNNKKLYIENLGCAKNQVDAEVLAFNLKKLGYAVSLEAKDADLIIVNTCGFIQEAKEESINTFFNLKRDYPDKKIIISGCLAQRYAFDLANEMKEADAVFGNKDLSKITDIVEKIEGKNKTDTVVLTPPYPDPDAERDTRDKLYSFPGSAYLKISEGCNHYCSYCAIPIIRGSLRSRPQKYVLEEARRLVETGIKEINIIAQDLAAYGMDTDGKSHFTELLKNICGIEGNFKIRLLYIHPDLFTEELLEIVKNEPKILHYFDIPFQHADSAILRSMGRKGNYETYSKLVSHIREVLPDSVIRTTIMLGYPIDSEEKFETVKNFVKKCRFNWMGCFIYSREEDTAAYALCTEEEHIELTKKAAKWKRSLEKLQEKITEDSLNSFIGKELDVLIEENVENEDLSIGRIYAQAPEVDGLTVVNGRDMIPGFVYRCKICRVNGIDLDAVRV